MKYLHRSFLPYIGLKGSNESRSLISNLNCLKNKGPCSHSPSVKIIPGKRNQQLKTHSKETEEVPRYCPMLRGLRDPYSDMDKMFSNPNTSPFPKWTFSSQLKECQGLASAQGVSTGVQVFWDDHTCFVWGIWVIHSLPSLAIKLILACKSVWKMYDTVYYLHEFSNNMPLQLNFER